MVSDCQKIISVMLNRFCLLSKNPPTPHPFITEKIKMDGIPTKIKWKIHTHPFYIEFEVLKVPLIIIWMQPLDILFLDVLW